MRARKIRVTFDPVNERIVRHWFHDARSTYNHGLLHLIEHNLQSLSIGRMQSTLHAKIITKEALSALDKDLMYTPKEIRYNAVKALCTAYKSNRTRQTNLKKKFPAKPLKKFEVKFKRRRENQQIKIPAQNTKLVPDEQGMAIHMFPRMYADHGPVRGRLSESFSGPLRDFDLIYDGLSFWVCLPFHREIPVEEDQRLQQRMGSVALDPGCRTFLSGYSADGLVFKMGEEGSTVVRRRLVRKQQAIKKRSHIRDMYIQEKTQGRVEKSAHLKRRKRLRRRVRRVNRRIKREKKKIAGYVDNLQWMACHALCRTSRLILLPRFNVLSCVKHREGRNISGMEKKVMLELRHPVFRSRLQMKAREYPGTHVVTFTEPYTSKTCGACGVMNATLGSSERFTCSSCQLPTLDRDIHAARNMYFRTFVTRP
jgi:transposase